MNSRIPLQTTAHSNRKSTSDLPLALPKPTQSEGAAAEIEEETAEGEGEDARTRAEQTAKGSSRIWIRGAVELTKTAKAFYTGQTSSHVTFSGILDGWTCTVSVYHFKKMHQSQCYYIMQKCFETN
jgi:hypothetical protein